MYKKIRSMLVKTTFIVVCIVYLCSMVFIPLMHGNWELDYLLKVWMDWQAFNVGMIALISSVIALQISIRTAREKQQSDNRQRERAFLAAKAFLPEALSELIRFVSATKPLLLEAWSKANSSYEGYKQYLDSEIPQISANYKLIFQRCIETADPIVANRLAAILRDLQLYQARVIDMQENFRPDSTLINTPSDIEMRMFEAGKLHAQISSVFKFARGLEEFQDTQINSQLIANSLLNLELIFSRYETLEVELKKYDPN